MIRKLQVKNFQSHESTDITFYPGVNVIVGPSDAGKTALIRSLRWVLFNSPRGSNFRSMWGGDTEVSVEIDNNKITRRKTSTINEYRLNEKSFKSFGFDVPLPISELVNMSSINVLTQYDSPFMIGWTPGERGLFLNRICNFEIIDRGIKSANSTLRKERVEIKSLESELERLKEEKEGLPDIKEMDRQLQIIESRHSHLEKLKLNFNSLKTLLNDIKSQTAIRAEYDAILEAEGETKHIFSLCEKRTDIEEKHDDLEVLLWEISRAEKNRKKYDQIIKNKTLELKEEFPDICPICGGRVTDEIRSKI